MNIYNRSHRLAAAIFTIANLMEENEELRTKIKKLSLELVSMSVKLKDTDAVDANRIVGEIEKNSLELMSILDIASITGLVSKMNGDILKKEFQSFISDLGMFAKTFEIDGSASIRGIFAESGLEINTTTPDLSIIHANNKSLSDCKYKRIEQKDNLENLNKNGNGHRRKNLRKNTILDFVKGHNEVNIKDIASNIVGCSEKTIQRELIGLIGEGKIKRIGERRWSKYSAVSQG